MSTSRNKEFFYDIFREISKSVHSSTNVKEVLDLVVRKCTEAVNAKGALVRILNLATYQFELSASYGLSERYLSKGHVAKEKIITDLCRQNEVIIIEDVLLDHRVQYPKEAQEEGIQMMIDLPLRLRNYIVGIIRIFFAKKRGFSKKELNFLVSVTEQAALAIDKARLIEAQKSEYNHLILQAEKMSALGRMAAGIAHEINNPLAGIMLYSTNLIKKVPGEGPLKEGLEVIIHESTRCKSIIQELLEFSRDTEPKKVLANLDKVIEKSLMIMENEFRLHHIRIEKHLSGELPDTLLDMNQIEQVMVNLLLNAVEAIREHGVITIRSNMDPANNSLKIEIGDTGPGIAPELVSRIFEPFFSTKPKGTGLGLAVSFRIIHNHKGAIHLSSQPGEGTRFTIEIPFLQRTSSMDAGDYQNGAR